MCSAQKASSIHPGLAQASHLQKPFSLLTECLQSLFVPLILACHYIMEFIHFLKIGFKYHYLYLIYKLFDNKDHVSYILHLFNLFKSYSLSANFVPRCQHITDNQCFKKGIGSGKYDKATAALLGFHVRAYEQRDQNRYKKDTVFLNSC